MSVSGRRVTRGHVPTHTPHGERGHNHGDGVLARIFHSERTQILGRLPSLPPG